jgi:hypothetical protein
MAGGDDTTRPRRQGQIFSYLPKISYLRSNTSNCCRCFIERFIDTDTETDIDIGASFGFGDLPFQSILLLTI